MYELYQPELWSRKVEAHGQGTSELYLFIRYSSNAFGTVSYTHLSGTGSGGAVNTAYTTNLIDGFRRYKNIVLNEELLKVYEAWIQEHPFDDGQMCIRDRVCTAPCVNVGKSQKKN